MAKYGLLLDLHRCTGCGACAIACKLENNVPRGYKWADYEIRFEGQFPDVKWEYIPILCNHCDNAPCIEVCPAETEDGTRKALYKADNGMTLHDPETCIHCGACEDSCPYGAVQLTGDEAQEFWEDPKGQEVAEIVGASIPYSNPNRERTYVGLRPEGNNTVEKCNFCDHRVTAGKTPYCVEACPSEARIFGDQEDPGSDLSQYLDEYDSHDAGWLDQATEPNVFYVRDFDPKK